MSSSDIVYIHISFTLYENEKHGSNPVPNHLEIPMWKDKKEGFTHAQLMIEMGQEVYPGETKTIKIKALKPKTIPDFPVLGERFFFGFPESIIGEGVVKEVIKHE